MVDRSVSLIKKAATIGVVSAFVATSAILALMYSNVAANAPLLNWVDYSLVNALFVGGAVGCVYGIGANHKITISLIVGLLAGAVTSLLVHVAPIIVDATAFLIWRLSSLLDISLWFRKLAVSPIEGMIQSLFIWITLAQSEKLSRTFRDNKKI